MKCIQRRSFRRFSIVLFFILSYYVNGQVVFTNDLDQITTDVCTGTSKKITVSVTNGSCSLFEGNLNSVSFTWQIESNPGVWQNIDSYPVLGLSYTIDNKIKAGGTVISSILVISSGFGMDEGVFNYRVLAQGYGGCPVAISLNEAISVKKNRWLGTVSEDWSDPANWSCNRVPTSVSSAVILPASNKPKINADANAKDLILHPGSNLTLNSGYFLNVWGPITVLGDGNFTVQNNSNLLQSSYSGSNTGPIHVNRNSSSLMRQDYTLWSSPVSGQNLLSFSPLTLANRFYVFNPLANSYSAINPSSNDFQVGKGYLIRMPNNHPTTPTIWTGQFFGVPNNGTIVVTTENGGAGSAFNAIGNPYPSAIKLSSFVSANSTKISGTLYFWRKTNNATTDPGYCTWTLAGFVSNGESQAFNPNGILRTGQGFLVEMVNGQNKVVFDNGMRLSDTADQFFKADTNNDGQLIGDTFKLNVTSNTGFVNQMLLGYFEDATLGNDYGIDGKDMGVSEISLTSLIDGVDYAIQGRPSFNVNDVVPLSFKTNTAGQYAISINQLEGVFLGDQNIYLKDNLLNLVHDLKAGNYVFISDEGTFQSRFEIVYQNNFLNSNGVDFNVNNVLVYKAHEGIEVQANGIELDNVKVFDVAGRLLVEKNVGTISNISIPLKEGNGVILVQVILKTGAVVTKKVIN